jgi:hypothetical protein
MYHGEHIALCLSVVLMQAETPVAGALPLEVAERLVLTRPEDAETAARALASGAIVGHGFANFYAITTRPDAETIRSVNLFKGRPPTQAGSITTTPSRIATVWDFLVRALRATGGDYLYITSANRSRHVTGASDEPAHYRADGLRQAFGHDPRFVLLEHEDERAARAAYPAFAATSTSIVGLHRLVPSRHARATLILERHGSLPVEHVRRAVAELGFDVVSGPGAFTRLTPRQYTSAA